MNDIRQDRFTLGVEQFFALSIRFLQSHFVVWWKPQVSMSSRAEVLFFSALFFICLIISYLALGVQLDARFGLVDDHEIMRYLGTDQEATIGEFWQILLEQTEIGAFGEMQRFRPIYYSFRVIETILWDGNVAYWYLVRIVLFAFFSAAFVWLFTKFVGLLLASSIVTFTFFNRYWADIWMRLGPAEQYMSLGIAIFAMGSWVLCNRYRLDSPKMDGPFIAASVGAAIAFGSKENAFFLILPVVVALIWGVLHKRLGFASVIVGLFSVALAGLIVASTIMSMAQNEWEDIYGKSLDWSILYSLPVLISIFAVLATAILSCGIYIFARKTADRAKAVQVLSDLRWLWLATIALMLVVTSQAVFYKGAWPADNRYDFPGMLAIPASLLLAYHFAVVGVNVYWGERRSRFWAGFAIFVFLLVSVSQAEWFLYRAAKSNASSTAGTMEYFDRALLLAEANPNLPIFLTIGSPRYIEAALNVPLILRYLGLKSEMYLDVSQMKAPNPNRKLIVKWDKSIRNASKFGNYAFEPMSKYAESGADGCISVVIDSPPNPTCLVVPE